MLRYVMAAFALLACSGVQAAGAMGISVSPISVTLDASRPSAAVTLSNETAESKVIQVSLMSWAHENNGEDRFAPATEMLANPPIFRVAAGAKQIVRVGLRARGKVDFTAEKTYRLFLEEIPETAPPAAAPAATAGGAGLRLMLRFGIPVFVSPAQSKPEAMRWTVSRSAPDQLKLSVTNDSNVHLRLSEVRLQTAAGQTVDAPNFAYVFAGETYSWILHPAKPWPAGAVTVAAHTDAGPMHAPLQLQGP